MPERHRSLLRRWGVAGVTLAVFAFPGAAAAQPAPDPRPGPVLQPDPAPLAGQRTVASRAPSRHVVTRRVAAAAPSPPVVVRTPAARPATPKPAARPEPRSAERVTPHAPPRDPPLEFRSAAGLVFADDSGRRALAAAALLVLALVLASGSFVALVAQVRRGFP